MTFRFDGYNHLVRLQKGELLAENLLKLVSEQKITGAWITGLGGAMWAEVGFYDITTQHYRWKKFDQPLEILSLQGNIAWEVSPTGGQPLLHIHGTFGDEHMNAFGGHVKELQVAGTCELLLHRWYEETLTRSHDAMTGLKLLDV